jgi:hypothetical protein
MRKRTRPDVRAPHWAFCGSAAAKDARDEAKKQVQFGISVPQKSALAVSDFSGGARPRKSKSDVLGRAQ